MHQTYGQIPDIRHVPDSKYPAACLPDPDQDQISKNANIRRRISGAPDIRHNPNDYIIYINELAASPLSGFGVSGKLLA